VKLEPKVIQANTNGKDYLQLLSGPPESMTMRAGKVVLQPGKTVGKHSTGSYEELLVLLAGEGLFLLTDGQSLEISAGNVLYCPPDTEHDVKNTGTKPLEYIYVVAKAG
jgi:quercetin dioxygenase-like cupin family protein